MQNSANQVYSGLSGGLTMRSAQRSSTLPAQIAHRTREQVEFDTAVSEFSKCSTAFLKLQRGQVQEVENSIVELRTQVRRLTLSDSGEVQKILQNHQHILNSFNDQFQRLTTLTAAISADVKIMQESQESRRNRVNRLLTNQATKINELEASIAKLKKQRKADRVSVGTKSKSKTEEGELSINASDEDIEPPPTPGASIAKGEGDSPTSA